MIDYVITLVADDLPADLYAWIVGTFIAYPSDGCECSYLVVGMVRVIIRWIS